MWRGSFSVTSTLLKCLLSDVTQLNRASLTTRQIYFHTVTNEKVEVCFDVVRVNSLSGYTLAHFLYRMLLLPIRLIVDWLPSRERAHILQDTDTKKNILFSLWAWNLPSCSYLKKYATLSTQHWCNSTKWPPRFEPGDAPHADGRVGSSR